MPRLMMNLQNANYGHPQQIQLNHSNIANLVNMNQNQRPMSSLNSPMIGRVYKAKPGCSACGKKVM